MKIFKGCQKVAGRGLISWFIKSKKCQNTRKKDASSVLLGIRQLPIFPTNASTVRKGRAASPQRRHPSAPLLTGLPPRCIPHRGRSAPPHRQPLAAAPRPGEDTLFPHSKRKHPAQQGVSFWNPAATYLSGPSPAKYCRRIRA